MDNKYTVHKFISSEVDVPKISLFRKVASVVTGKIPRQRDDGYELEPTVVKLSKKAKVCKYASYALFVFGLLLIIAYIAPPILQAGASAIGIDATTKRIGITAQEARTGFVPKKATHKYQPVLDTSLPKQNSLKISSAGIDSPINEASYEDYEEALKKGTWIVPDYGDPYNRKAPVILAAHRFGYLKWSISYRLKNSFYNLPKAKEGDVIEIVWNQRKYKYAIYAESEGPRITDYDADLILYTCLDLSSEVRIFRYAKLLEV